MLKLCVALAAAVFAVASASAHAEEVKLTDQDRIDLRQRADALRQRDLLGRDQSMSDRILRPKDHPVKTRAAKKHSKKYKRRGRT